MRWARTLRNWTRNWTLRSSGPRGPHGPLGPLGSLGLGMLCLLGAGSLVWAMCAVFVAHDPAQIVAAVGSLGISGIAGVALFVVRVSRGTESSDSAAGRTVVVVAARGAAPFSSVAIEGGLVHAHLAVGLAVGLAGGLAVPSGASPPKLAVFVIGASPAGDLEPE